MAFPSWKCHFFCVVNRNLILLATEGFNKILIYVGFSYKFDSNQKKNKNMRKLRKLFTLLGCGLFIFLQATFSQTKQLKGKVTDARDGTPISGATIQAKTHRYQL